MPVEPTPSDPEQTKELFHRLIEEGFTVAYLAALHEIFADHFEEHQHGIEPRSLRA